MTDPSTPREDPLFAPSSQPGATTEQAATVPATPKPLRDSEDTTWFGSMGHTAPQPVLPPPPGPRPTPDDAWAASAAAAPTTTRVRPQRPQRRVLELATAVVLTALVASGGMYAATSSSRGAAPLLAGSSASASATGAAFTPNTTQPVVQANAQAPDWSATAAAASPSVVSITIYSTQSSTSRNGYGQQQQQQPSTSEPQAVGQGSGVIIDGSGHVLTNNHVAAPTGYTSTTLSVTLNDKRTYDATIVGTDASTDLAVIKLKDAPSDLKPIAFGDDTALKVGDQVMAVGNPLGLAGTVTTGIVSALNRPVTTSQEEESDSPWGNTTTTGQTVVTNAIQTSAAINPGNSGGALVDVNGALVGINSSIASTSSSSGNIGIGFAIPETKARAVAAQLIKVGKATHPFLGVNSSDGTVADGTAKRAAAIIAAVTDGSPAHRAGIEKGDAVISIGGELIDGSLSLTAQIRERSVGDKVTIVAVRDGERKTFEVTLAERQE